jgi:uncharacterized membrane protein
MKPFLWSVPFKLFFVGFLLVFVGFVFVVIAGFVSGGWAGVVWILPFPPIVVGAGWPYPVWALVLTVILTVLGIVLFVFIRKRVRV